jgi:hypothetical protein
MDLGTTAASNIVALVLGATGIAIALVPILREWRASRHARLIVGLEKLYRQDTGSIQERLRIQNLGPSVAQQVTVEKIGAVAPDSYRPAFEWVLPVEVLQSGQDYILLLAPALADKDPSSVVLTWRDGAGERRAEFALSPKYL